AEPGGGIDDAEIEAEVVQALVHEAREHGRRPIERVLRRQEPERLLADPAAPALGHGHVERVRDPLAREIERLHRRVPPDAAKLLAHERGELRPVPVGVDDRMLQAGVELPGLGLCAGDHRRSSWAKRAGWMILLPGARWPTADSTTTSSSARGQRAACSRI